MKYRKKPVVVEAIQFQDEVSCFEYLQDKMGLDPVKVDYKIPDKPVLKIETLEGIMIASLGDYIIKGAHGELYPCKPDIFEETYEKAE